MILIFLKKIKMAIYINNDYIRNHYNEILLMNTINIVEDYTYEEEIRDYLSKVNEFNAEAKFIHLFHNRFPYGERLIVTIFCNFKHVIKLKNILPVLPEHSELTDKIIKYYYNKLRTKDVIILSMSTQIYNKHCELFDWNGVHYILKNNLNKFFQDIKAVTAGSRGEDQLLNILVEFYKSN